MNKNKIELKTKKTEKTKILDEIKELKEKLAKAEGLVEERLNQLKYLQADIENLRKRFDKEKEQVITLANEHLIKELVIILDDFDSSIKLLANDENKRGLLMLKNKFFKILADKGLNEIKAMNKRFNPHFHDILYNEFSKKEEGEIIEEIQKGYEFKSKVIRPSKVKISKGLKKEDKSKEDKKN